MFNIKNRIGGRTECCLNVIRDIGVHNANQLKQLYYTCYIVKLFVIYHYSVRQNRSFF